MYILPQYTVHSPTVYGLQHSIYLTNVTHTIYNSIPEASISHVRLYCSILVCDMVAVQSLQPQF